MGRAFTRKPAGGFSKAGNGISFRKNLPVLRRRPDPPPEYHMTKELLKFDEIGIWSEIKLDIVEQYGSAYTKAFAGNAIIEKILYRRIQWRWAACREDNESAGRGKPGARSQSATEVRQIFLYRHRW